MKPPKRIAAPVVEPISVNEARVHLEAQRYADPLDSGADTTVDDADDVMIEAFIAAAREHCEAFLGLSLSTRTLEVALDSFPTSLHDSSAGIELPLGPVREIVQITVGDATSASDNTLDPSTYTLDDYSLVARALPVNSWPAAAASLNTIRVRYTAGYGVDSDGGEPLPKVIRAAMLLIVGHLFANREDTAEKALAAIPVGAEALMRPLRVRKGMA